MKGLFSVPPSLLNGRMNGQSKKGRTKWVALLNSTGAVHDLITSIAGAREEVAIMAIAAVHPWNERGEVRAD